MEPGLTQFPGSTHISAPAAPASRSDYRLHSGLQQEHSQPTRAPVPDPASRARAVARLETIPVSDNAEKLHHAHTHRQKLALSSYLDQQEFLNRQEQAEIFASMGVDLYV